MTAYLQTFEWGVDFVEENLGEPMGDMQSRLYAERGIRPGDTMYLAYIDERRRLNLVSRLVVESMKSGGPDDDYVITPVADTSTPMRLSRRVPASTARQLRFLVRRGFDSLGEPVYASRNTALSFESDGSLTGQTARTIRRLNARSAELLEDIIAATE